MQVATGAQLNLYAHDPEALAAFYSALGLEERFRFPAEGRPAQVEVAIGGMTLGLTSREAMSRLAGLPVAPGPAQCEVVLWCSDARQLWERACGIGGRPLAEPQVSNDRLLAGWAAEPEGNRVKVVSLVDRYAAP